MVWCSLCSFLIIKPQTALHHAVWCTVTYSVVRLSHFVDDFGVVFAVWWTLLTEVEMELGPEISIFNLHILLTSSSYQFYLGKLNLLPLRPCKWHSSLEVCINATNYYVISHAKFPNRIFHFKKILTYLYKPQNGSVDTLFCNLQLTSRGGQKCNFTQR